MTVIEISTRRVWVPIITCRTCQKQHPADLHKRTAPDLHEAGSR